MGAVNGVYDAFFVRVVLSEGSGVLNRLRVTSSLTISQGGGGLSRIASTVLM